jgi:hypothetical protein
LGDAIALDLLDGGSAAAAGGGGGADLELRRDLCEREDKARKGFMVVER